MFGIGFVKCLSEDDDDNKKALAKLFFKLSDKNQSNGVDHEELKQFLRFVASFDKSINSTAIADPNDSIKRELDETLIEVFEKFDLDRKGFLNEQEFAKFFTFYL